MKTADGLYVYDSVASNATAHYLNNLLFLLGGSMNTAVDVDEISAQCSKANDIESFDTCIVRAKTVDNQDVLFIASHAVDEAIDPILEIKCEKAVINCDFAKENGRLTATMNNGETVDYGEVSTLREQYEKIVSVLNWLDGKTSEKPNSTVMTTESFTKIIDYIFENIEFKKFDDIADDKEKNRLYASGLYEKLKTEFYS